MVCVTMLLIVCGLPAPTAGCWGVVALCCCLLSKGVESECWDCLQGDLVENCVYDNNELLSSCLSTVYEMVEVVLVAATVSTVSSRPGVTTGLVGLGESCIKYF